MGPDGAVTDAAAAVDPARYRQAMGRFATGVAVVTSRHRGHDVALTVDSLTSVSLAPVLLLVSLHPEARVLEGVESGEPFGVSILPARLRGMAQWLGEPGRPLHNQLVRVPHERGSATGVALVEGALAAFECRTYALHPAGDHVLVVGEVLSLQARPTDDAALVHYRGGLGELR
ncbi:flavin reductase family protein [Ornithinimicrobium cerasi]|uniref:NADH-FMN oxidoreductase RutF, flavin reductase (DIM6/NTAB) family n=1 Tax=Ornithinimicrobium cerasi TaxID=2248773 RepID=A0A285VNR1_9MICO|nr:flavin reductase family protein [Ornithinimicrobium cerasi]SOC55699.1 NADH-FMN oxidoreductase RutF, flavin reductase (DIM6/NTAB) family [Ornithinimicrobium cerasi]